MKIAEIKNNSMYSWFYILLLAGYIFISSWPYFLSVESRVITIPFRAFVLICSIGIILYSYYSKSNSKFNSADYFFIFFWIIYLINIYFSFKNYEFEPEVVTKKAEIYLRVIGICFLPSLAILTCNPKYLNYQFILKVIYILFFAVLLLNVIIGIEYNHQGRSSGILATYSISFGHYGVTLSLLSLYYLFFKTETFTAKVLLYVSGFFLGLYILYASATRGPLVSLIVASGYILYVKTNIRYFIVLNVFILLLILFLFWLDLEIGTSTGNTFFNRLNSMIVSGNSSGREVIYKNALSIFRNNPIFGGPFLLKDGTYAHNFIIDIVMSMGVFGLFVFMGFYKNCLSFVLTIKNKLVSNIDTLWINIIFVQFIIFVSFSCSLFDAPEFWYLTAITLVMFKTMQKNVYKQN